MHTFFINTSKKSIDDYDALFDIHYETKTLVSLSCPLVNWYDEKKGYIRCTEKMSELIDGYVELNNAFNLIIYIDLPEFEAYSSIKRDMFHDAERELYFQAMQILFTHIISETILNELVNVGRRPQEVLLMLGKEKRFMKDTLISDTNRKAVNEIIFDLIGLPDEDVVKNCAIEINKNKNDDTVTALKEKVSQYYNPEIIPGIRKCYLELLDRWYEKIIEEKNVAEANEWFFDIVSRRHAVETGRIGIETVSCPYDSYATKANKAVAALSQLNVALFLLKCVMAKSIFQKNVSEYDEPKQVMDFHAYNLEEIAPILEKKKKVYDSKIIEIESLAKSYQDLNLAPSLYELNYKKFGLDEHGYRAMDLVVYNISSDEQDNAKKETEEKAEINQDESIVLRTDQAAKLVEAGVRPLFNNEELEPFSYNFKYDDAAMYSSKTPPEKYIEQAKKVRIHHIDYLKKLKIHISRSLSNYASKSKANKPALLQVGDDRYSTGKIDNQPVESASTIANQAYKTMLKQFMEFSASRQLGITDIEQQCNWFLSRINQIRESLTKIKCVAIGLLIALVVLYVPFWIIQFEEITLSYLSFATALASTIAPIGLLYASFVVMITAQRKKYSQAWKQFVDKSDEVLKENTMAVMKYDRLLSTYIPALRWIYEYKLDVDYCDESCVVADAKIEHHRLKIRNRSVAIKNILADLEYPFPDKTLYYNIADTDSIDYNVSFCTGEENCSFYSVLDTKTLGLNKE